MENQRSSGTIREGLWWKRVELNVRSTLITRKLQKTTEARCALNAPASLLVTYGGERQGDRLSTGAA